MNFVLGSCGRLGAALARAHQAGSITCLGRAIYQDWHCAGADQAVADYFAPWAGRGATVYIAAGLLDPHIDPRQIDAVNLDLPMNVVAGAGVHGLRVVTFGTVMEGLLARQNAYVHSKAALGRHIAALAAGGADVAHVQLHTLYGGGAPSPFMFLGLILESLRTQTPFRMTQGKQLREYHHVDDVANAVVQLIAAGRRGVFDLSSGEPIALRTLAESLFAAFDATDLLQLGTMVEPADENYATVLTRDRLLAPDAFRPALPAIRAVLAQCGIAPRIFSSSRPAPDQ